MNKTVFAKRLKKARMDKGLTQKELANHANVSVATVSKYEQADTSLAKISPTIETVYLFANILAVSVDWLCGLTDNPVLQTDTEALDYTTFVRSIFELLNQSYKKTGIFRDDTQYGDCILISIDTSYPLGHLIDDYLKSNEAFISANMPDDIRKGALQFIVDKYKRYSIDELCQRGVANNDDDPPF